MGKNLARMEMQVFIEELVRRMPHMKLAPQTFSYLPNTSFRGPEHLRVEWDPALNPERKDASVREGARLPVRIGEPSQRARTLVVERVDPVADGIVRLRLVAPDYQPLPRWTPGSHIDVECGDPDLSRQYSLCSDPAERDALEIAVLREIEGRGGSAWVHANVRAGDRVRVRGPRNHFRLDEQAGKLVFIAGGIGITPISAMARRAKSLGLDYTLHYSGRRRATMAFLAELERLHGARLEVYASDEGGATTSRACSPRPIATPRSTPAARCACSGARGGLRALARGRTARRALRLDHRHARPHEGARLRGRAQGLRHHPARSPPTRRCSARCARRTSTSRATVRKACAARARCACSQAQSITATSC